MRYYSTRDVARSSTFRFSRATELGLAPDGGLFVPEYFPQVGTSFKDADGSFLSVAKAVLTPFLADEISELELTRVLGRAFSFPITLEEWDQNNWVLDLTRGPTAAFKDVGARFLAHWMNLKISSPKTVLVATSGDTGGAVASAFSEFPEMKVVLLFPKSGVSVLQKKQLSCWGKNTLSLEIEGSFDDAQKIVKGFLHEPNLVQELGLTSANSISIARLLPQACYYAYSSLLFREKTGRKAEFIIPTGNMGNSLAALWAKEMGFPIEAIRLATNANLTLSNYWHSKKYEPRPSVHTLANAMDVGNPSNFERFSALTREQRENNLIKEMTSVSDLEIREQIQNVFKTFGQAICPHTACAFALKDPATPQIVVQTAAAAKFSEIVEPIIGQEVPRPPALDELLHRKTNFTTIKAQPDLILKAIRDL